MFKELLQISYKKDNWIKNEQKIWTEDTWTANASMKKMLSIISRHTDANENHREIPLYTRLAELFHSNI